MLRSVAACCLVCAACLKFETYAQTLAPLRAAGNLSTIELSPLLVAADKIYPGEISVTNGGIPASTLRRASIASLRGNLPEFTELRI